MVMDFWFRRIVLALALAAAVGGVPAGGAQALEVEAARSHVAATVDMVVGLIEAQKPRSEAAKALRGIFERQAALKQLARFCAGRYWRGMADEHKDRYIETFSDHLAYVYAGYFKDFSGDPVELREAMKIVNVMDAGKKGVLVRSEIRAGRQAPVQVDWLISDRLGRVAISDLVVEGISLAVTQREVVSAMFEKRSGDVAQVIADMEREQGKSGS